MYQKIEELEEGPIKRSLIGWRKYIRRVYMGHSIIVVEWKSRRRWWEDHADLERLLIAMGFNTIAHNHRGEWIDERHIPVLLPRMC